MPFTDDNIAALKESMCGKPKSAYVLSFEVQDMEALLARTQAAENALIKALSHGKSDSCDECMGYINTWKAIKGEVSTVASQIEKSTVVGKFY